MKPARSTRATALLLLSSVLKDRRTLDEAQQVIGLSGNSPDTRFVMLMALTVLRHLGQIDALLKRYVTKPLPPRRETARNALRLGVAQLLLLETPPHAALNETVEAVKQSNDDMLSGLVNAVLQKINKEKPALPQAMHNIPAWLRTRWETQYGPAVMQAIAEVASQRPPLDLHLPAPATLPEGERIDHVIWRLNADHMPVNELPGFMEGAFWVQDLAASYPARLLGDVKGKRVLDVAAAPGGKTAQLARAGGVVTALDKSVSRMATLKENTQRLKLHVEAVTANALRWETGEQFDAILLDAPCSATGTWRKHPEVLQLVEEKDIAELVGIQRKMLSRAAGWLKPGGRMVYCVCSLEREEGENQVEWFLGEHKDFRLVPADIPGIDPQCFTKQGTLRTLPHYHAERGGMDGFFAALFERA